MTASPPPSEGKCDCCYEGKHPIRVRAGLAQTGCIWDQWRAPGGSIGLGDNGVRLEVHDAKLHAELRAAREVLQHLADYYSDWPDLNAIVAEAEAALSKQSGGSP